MQARGEGAMVNIVLTNDDGVNAPDEGEAAGGFGMRRQGEHRSLGPLAGDPHRGGA